MSETNVNGSYFSNGRIRGHQSTNNGWQVNRPECTFSLPIIEQDRTVESSVNIQVP